MVLVMGAIAYMDLGRTGHDFPDNCPHHCSHSWEIIWIMMNPEYLHINRNEDGTYRIVQSAVFGGGERGEFEYPRVTVRWPPSWGVNVPLCPTGFENANSEEGKILWNVIVFDDTKSNVHCELNE